jgi:hypothetical protein
MKDYDWWSIVWSLSVVEHNLAGVEGLLDEHNGTLNVI